MPPRPQLKTDAFQPPLPVRWANLTSKNVKQLQRLNATIFPVKYADKFYADALRAPEGFIKLAFHNDLLVGAVCCRKEVLKANVDRAANAQNSTCDKSVNASTGSKLYIMTLGVLATYRERGIGTQLIHHVLNLVSTSPICKDVSAVYLHVQEGNDDAIRFYQRFGFAVKEKLVGYYRRIHPADCYIVEKDVAAIHTTQSIVLDVEERTI